MFLDPFKVLTGFINAMKKNPPLKAQVIAEYATPHAELVSKAVAKLVDEKPARHLVILSLPIKCPCDDCARRGRSGFQARAFTSLIDAETFRTGVYRKTGNETRLVSSARVCERFAQLRLNYSAAEPEVMLDFLADQFMRATSPMFN